jgi:hypothetical protein
MPRETPSLSVSPRRREELGEERLLKSSRLRGVASGATCLHTETRRHEGRNTLRDVSGVRARTTTAEALRFELSPPVGAGNVLRSLVVSSCRRVVVFLDIPPPSLVAGFARAVARWVTPGTVFAVFFAPLVSSRFLCGRGGPTAAIGPTLGVGHRGVAGKWGARRWRTSREMGSGGGADPRPGGDGDDGRG